MDANTIIFGALILSFAAFGVCLWCVRDVQRQFLARLQDIVILLRARDGEEAAMTMDVAGLIDRREKKQKTKEDTLREAYTPEEAERDMVAKAAQRYANEDLNAPFPPTDD